MSHSNSDRNLLFGILALQMELVTRDQLIAAIHAWLRADGPSLGEILVRQQILPAERQSFLDELVRQRIGADDGLSETQSGTWPQEPAGGELATQPLRELWDGTSPVISPAGPARDEDAGSTPPTVLGGRFQILGPHKEGGLGRVLRARDAELGRDVAVKEIKPKHANHPDGWWERAARWMRRHRARVQTAVISLTVTAIVLLLATFLVPRAWRSEKTARELATRSKQEAVTRFVQAREAVDKWLTGAGYALGHYPGVQKTRERLLELAAEDYEQFTRQHSDDLELEIERGRTYLRLGHVRLVLRDAAGAKVAYQEAQALFSELTQRHPESLDCQTETANCQTNLGVVAMETGDIGQADQAYQTSISQLEAIAQTHPEATLPRTALARVLSDQGELFSDTGRPGEALRALSRCVELLTRLVQEAPQAQEHQASLVDAQDLLGRILLERGRYAEAVKHIQDAADRAATLLDLEPGDPQRLEHRASASIYLASALRVLGRMDEEGNAYGRAIEDYRLLCEVLPGVPQFRESWAISQTNLAGWYYKLGRLEDAERELKPAQEVLQRLTTENPGFPRYVDEWAYGRNLQGEILRDRGQAAEAQAACRDAIQVYERLLPNADQETSPDVTKYQESLALCHSHLGLTCYHLAWLLANCQRAELRAPEKAAILAKELTAEAPGNPAYWNCLGVASYRLGVWESSAKNLEQAVRLRGCDDARDWFFLAMAHWQLKREGQAREGYHRARQAFEQTMPGNLEVRRIEQEASGLIEGVQGGTTVPRD